MGSNGRYGHCCRVHVRNELNSSDYIAVILQRAQATPWSIIARVRMAIEKSGGLQAVNLKVAEKYAEAYSGLARAGNTLIVPSNMADLSSLIAGAMSVMKSVAPGVPSQAGA